MIYVKRKTPKKTSEKQYLRKIWKFVKAESIVYFKKKQLKELSEEFSQSEYYASFLIPDYASMDQFISWLWLYKSKRGVNK